jgi:hypothetical protein
MLCTAPTQSYKLDALLAPAGMWLIEVEYEGTPVDFLFYVQSDQSAVRQSLGGKRAKFDHPNYETHIRGRKRARPTSIGGGRDSFFYDPFLPERFKNKGEDELDAEYWPEYGPVQRRGTLNALAAVAPGLTDGSLLCIAGYDETSGRPAIYSGTADGNASEDAQRRSVLTAAFPSESAPNHLGLLAAGSKNGSVVAYRGTSMATALATRWIVEAFVEGLQKGASLSSIGTEAFVARFARAQVQNPPPDAWGQSQTWGRGRMLKSGAGSIPMPPSFLSGKVRRLGSK